MKKKIIGIVMCMLLAGSVFTFTTEAISPYKRGIDADTTNFDKVDDGVHPIDKGCTITESLIGFIRALSVEENQTSFSAIKVVGTGISKRDDGGMAVYLISLRNEQVCWVGEYTFQGILRPHIICGRVRYREE